MIKRNEGSIETLRSLSYRVDELRTELNNRLFRYEIKKINKNGDDYIVLGSFSVLLSDMIDVIYSYDLQEARLLINLKKALKKYSIDDEQASKDTALIKLLAHIRNQMESLENKTIFKDF